MKKLFTFIFLLSLLASAFGQNLSKIVKNDIKILSNSRFIRNVFELMVKYQAIRLSKSMKINEDELTLIIIEDFNNAINETIFNVWKKQILYQG